MTDDDLEDLHFVAESSDSSLDVVTNKEMYKMKLQQGKLLKVIFYGAFIVYCNTAMLPMYQLLIYDLPHSAAQHNVLHLKLKLI